MTVAAQTVSQSIVAAGGQTAFPFTFRCDDSTLLRAYVNDVDMGALAVALNADQIGNPGGIVTLGPCTAGDITTIERVTPQTQVTAFGTFQPFPSSAVSAALDKVVMLLQEFWALLSRVPRIKRAGASKMLSFDLPTPVVGSSIGWGDAGGGKFSLINMAGGGGGGGGGGAGTAVVGESLADTGDHIHFNIANVPLAGKLAVYRSGQRVFLVDDYAMSGPKQIAFINPLIAGERADADYTY